MGPKRETGRQDDKRVCGGRGIEREKAWSRVNNL